MYNISQAFNDVQIRVFNSGQEDRPEYKFDRSEYVKMDEWNDLREKIIY